MLSFTSDQWVIVALIFVLGLLVGGFLFSGGGRKWKTRYNSEIERRRELERTHAEREKDWRQQESLHAAALKDRARDPVIAPRDPVVGDDIRRARAADAIPVVDRNGDGVIDERDR
jgi:hypothetical protein